MSLIDAYAALVARTNTRLSRLRFAAPVTHVYNPLEYALPAHLDYFRRHAKPGVTSLLLGMNPGPWGMAQTGVPFGEVSLVRDWLGVSGAVGKPTPEHPARPVTGFACKRSEVSGARLWGFARDEFGTPEKFFARYFVVNYCPLVFMEESGRNFTPDKLPVREREALHEVCDELLRETVALLGPKQLIGVGAYAEAVAKHALAAAFPALSYARVLHPSPASPAANRGWAEAARAVLGGHK